MTRKIYIMRHGETLFNTQKRVQGWCDSPLTENGIAQAQVAGAYFNEEGVTFDKVYSSTQERATDTAKIVSGIEQVQQLKGLKEMNFGSFEAQPEHLLPKFRPGAKSFEDLLVSYGGEDIIQVGKRVKDCVEEVLEMADGETLLMVSHGAAMWGLMLELGITFPEGLYFTNCSICEFEVTDKQLNLVKLIDPLAEKIYDF
ncbi:histidine phosphatase family protein [Streptococcus caprae]|uniref:Histidine phosphatase family protein n=1 Tax=Streptococcus caprae TaxID=1640501 RepID=A0ABV8CVG0_9STRE